MQLGWRMGENFKAFVCPSAVQQWEHSRHLSLSTKKDCAPLRGLFGKCVDAWSQKCQDNSSSRFDHPGHSLFLVTTLCIKGTPQWDQKLKCTVTHLVLSYHTGTSVTFIRCRTTLTWMWRWSNTVWLLCTRRTLPSYGISLHLNLRRHVNIGRRGDMFEEDLSMCFATVEIIDDIDVVWAEGCLMVNSTACLAALACASLGRQSMWLRSLALGWEKMHLQDVDFFTHDLSLQLAWINLEAWSEHFIWIHLNGSFPTIWVFSAWFSGVFVVCLTSLPLFLPMGSCNFP